MSTEEQDWDLQAAEFVLGTLNDQDRKVFDTLYQVDKDWQRRVHRWQARLDPLNVLTQAVEPPSHILSAVLARIDKSSSLKTRRARSQASSSADLSFVNEPPPVAAEQMADEIRQTNDDYLKPASESLTLSLLKERVRYWKFATAIAVASLVGILFMAPRYFDQRLPRDNAVRTVAVLQSESDGPLWAVSYLMDTRSNDSAAKSTGTISVTAVGDPQLTAEQSHQLWMVLPEGAGVRSVGLVPDRQGETVTLELPIELAQAGEFAVSLEPLGGVPGPEHGPVVTRTFILQAPD